MANSDKASQEPKVSDKKVDVAQTPKKEEKVVASHRTVTRVEKKEEVKEAKPAMHASGWFSQALIDNA